jgi:penicillin-binding protein 1A
LLGLVCFTYGLVHAVAGQIPQLDPAHRHVERNGYIYAGDGKTILAVLRGDQARVVVSSDQIAPIMKQAIVAIEDRRFYEHRGIDLRGMLRAIWADMRHSKVVQGGSTITQQFVKNSYVTNERSIGRKLKEAALAWQLEQQWSKDKILTAYLNTIYFGNGAYGIQQAAVAYFGHGASKLTLPEAALLAGIPSDPSLYDPATNPKAARGRRRVVLQAMLDQHDITYNQFRLANRSALPKPQDIRLPATKAPGARAQYFVNYVTQQLVDRYGPGRVFGGGLRVKTTIDLQLQKLGQQAIAKWLPNPQGPSAALVAIDPRDGRVLAMVGGRSFRESQFNLAVQGERQPGSSFKPFVLATALAEGVSPSTVFVSHPVVISLGDRLWPVHNYEGANLGPINLEQATIHSDNTVYAQLTQLVQPSKVVMMSHELGITSHLDNYFSIGLGTAAVNPLEMARAYSTFADAGSRVDGSIFGNRPRAIVSVNDTPNRPTKRPVLGPSADATVTTLLQKVITEGTGQRAALADRPAAGKTGTTENYGDAWFVGYVPQLVVAVWVGYPNKLVPMLTEYHGQAVAGGTFPALIWKSFMQSALSYLQRTDPDGRWEPQSFPSPEYGYAAPKTLVLRNGQWRLDNGYCRNTVAVDYYSGFGPKHTADCKPNEVEVPRVVGMSIPDARARLEAQPLTPAYVYKPAEPKQRVDIVLGQFPSGGTLSSFDKVTLVLAKPLHGLVPRVIGLSATQAQARLAGRKLYARFIGGRKGRVVDQRPRPGVAAAPKMRVTLLVRSGRVSAAAHG